MLQPLFIWWATVPAFIRDIVEGAISAGLGAVYLTFQGINWTDPNTTPRSVVTLLVIAFSGGLLAYLRHKFTAPAAAVVSGSVTEKPSIVAATAAKLA
jgi:hypothetical protein